MRAITLWQPHGSLIALNMKRIETRNWCTDYRGPLAIHIAATTPRWWRRLCYEPPLASALTPLIPKFQELYPKARLDARDWVKSLPHGVVVATCRLTDCIVIANPHEAYMPKCDERGRILNPVVFAQQDGNTDKLFGDWTPGRYAWILANIKALPEPIPARGAQGLWEWDEEVLA